MYGNFCKIKNFKTLLSCLELEPDKTHLNRDELAKFLSLSNAALINDTNSHDANWLAGRLIQRFDTDEDGVLSQCEFWRCYEAFFAPVCSALLIVDVQNDFITGSLALSACPAGQPAQRVLPIINAMLERHFAEQKPQPHFSSQFSPHTSMPSQFDRVVCSLDWHPAGHISFWDNRHAFPVLLQTGDGGLEIASHDQVERIDPFETVTFRVGDQHEIMQQKLWPAHCIQHSQGAQLHADLKLPKCADRVYKGERPEIDTYSAFGLNHLSARTELHNLLTMHRINTLFVCGLATDVCVYHTCKDALKLSYNVIVVLDACAGVDEIDIKLRLEELRVNGALIIQSNQIDGVFKQMIFKKQQEILI